MKEKFITLTHLNVRESIAILLAKLVLTDIILAIIVIGFYFILVQSEFMSIGMSSNTSLFLSVFTILGLIKISLGIYIILQWLNEYYEITPHAIIHKRGIIVKKAEKYNLDKVRALRLDHSLLGGLFNYATITLYDIRLNKYMDMYLIHHPKRYVKILRMLRPHLETKSESIAIPFMPKNKVIYEFQEK